MPPFGSVPYAGDDSRITDILLRLGDIHARKAEQQGDIWGGAVAGIGQQADDLIQQHAERKSLAARDQALVELMGRTDATPQDFARVAGPKLGLETYAAVQAFNKTASGVSREEAAKLLPVQLKVFKKLTPEAKAQLFPALRQNSIKVGLFGEQDVPAAYTADLDPTIDAIIKAYEPDQKLEKLGRGEVLIDPATHEQVAAGLPPEPKVDTRGLDARYAEAVAAGDQKTAQELLAAKGRLEAAGRAPASPKEERLVQVSVNGVPTWVRESEAVGKPAAQAPRAVTGQERTALGFYNRAKEASENVASVEDEVAKSGLMAQGQLKYAPNLLKTEAQQAYTQAQRAFTEARLRKESGANITKDEYAKDAETYFAQPGDSAKTIEQKQKAREVVLDGLRFGAGKAYEEYYGEPQPTPSERQKKSGGGGGGGSSAYDSTDPDAGEPL